MLVFESQKPQDLLKEVAQYLRERATNQRQQANTAKTQKAEHLALARANALELVAQELDRAGIIPPGGLASLRIKLPTEALVAASVSGTAEGDPSKPCPHRTIYDDGQCAVCGTHVK